MTPPAVRGVAMRSPTAARIVSAARASSSSMRAWTPCGEVVEEASERSFMTCHPC